MPVHAQLPAFGAGLAGRSGVLAGSARGRPWEAVARCHVGAGPPRPAIGERRGWTEAIRHSALDG